MHPITRLPCTARPSSTAEDICTVHSQVLASNKIDAQKAAIPFVPSYGLIESRLREASELTNNVNLTRRPCGVCARMFPIVGNSSTILRTVAWGDLKNIANRLWQTHPELSPDAAAGNVYPERDLLPDCLRCYLIDPRAVMSNTERLEMNVCSDCVSALNSNKFPKMALANHTLRGRVPSELSALTFVERRIVARIRMSNCILKLKTRTAGIGQRGLRAHCIAVRQNPDLLFDVLPPPANRLPDDLKIVLVGRAKVDRAIVLAPWHTLLRARRSAIYSALLWLKKFVPDYSNVQISSADVESYPEDGIPAELENTAEYLCDAKLRDEAAVLSTVQLTEDIGPHESSGIATSAILDIGGDEIPLADMWASVLGTIKDRHVTALMTTDCKTESTYWNHQLFPRCYPCLFPWGIGGFEDPCRSTVLSLEDHIQLLLHRGDSDICAYPTFIFAVFDVIHRRNLCSKVSALIRSPSYKHAVSLIASADPESIEEAIQSKAKNQCVPFDHHAKKNLSALTLFGKKGPTCKACMPWRIEILFY